MEKTTPGNRQRFTVFLPGLKATVWEQADKVYLITDLELDARYFDAVGQSKGRMGLYRVGRREGDEWATKYVPSGRISNENGRMVAVSGTTFGNANRAAQHVVPRAMEAPGVATHTVARDGCDLHFTPGKRELGGLIRYSALPHKDSYGSAVLLADSMEAARDTKDVIWVADEGGSVILTQAFRILLDRGVTLPKHSAFLNEPRSSPGEATRLAHQLELKLSKNFASTGWSLRGALSQYAVAGLRIKNDNDRYDRWHHAETLINGITKTAAIVGLTGAGVGLAASVPAITSIGAIVAAGAGVTSHTGTGLSLGQSLVRSIKRKVKR